MQQTTPPIKQNLREALAEYRKAGDTKWQEIKAKNPHLSNFEMKSKPYCYQRRPSGFSKVIDRLMDDIAIPASKNYETGISYPARADMKQADIIERIKPLFPSHKILPNIWNRKLTKKQFARMQTLAWSNFRKPIDIKGCKTLAEVKRRIQAALHASDATYSFKGTITIDNDTVVIGNETYTIEKRISAGHEYPSIRVNVGGGADRKRQWLRVDVLRSILPYKMIIPEKNANKTTLQIA